VVTGGGSGIGTMIASAFVQNGAKVYIASRKEKQLKEVRAQRHTPSLVFFTSPDLHFNQRSQKS
jgi:short-subunit dehydrogenase involved in D-alanine esterification of teichoic acids